MRKTSRRVLILIVAGWLAPILAAQDDDRTRLEFYQSSYTELTAENDPRAARAWEIFARLIQVAGTRAGLVPRLFIAKNTSPPPPPAVAIQDGGIVISEQMLDLCYREPDKGDDRLAYILAHEIAHQIKNDFWPVMFFQAVELSRKADPKDSQALEEIKRELSLGEQEAAAEQRRKEIEADEMGIIYASLAGFDTRAVVMEDAKVNLFRFVESYLDPTNVQGVARDANHPTPEVRAAAVKARLQKALDAVDLFDAGLLFYRTGDFERAASLFTEFLREYPGREVYHNLAACHHQIAWKSYLEWKAEKGLPFKLLLPAEGDTRARRIVLKPSVRGVPTPGAAPESRFKDEIAKAGELYRRALAQDPSFWPSANNLGCALLLLDNPYEAVGLLQKAIQSAPGSALVLNNLGVAFYLTGNVPKAKEVIQAALKADPDSGAPLFNLGSIAALENDLAEAKKHWSAYLQSDPYSVWAKQIRLRLGLGEVPPSAPAKSGEAPEGLLGLTTDSYDDQIPADWGAPTKKKTLLGDLEIRMFANGVLVVSREGEIVRLSVAPPFQGRTAAGMALGAAWKDLSARYGRPSTVLPSGAEEAWVYPDRGITFILQNGKVVSWILFRRA